MRTFEQEMKMQILKDSLPEPRLLLYSQCGYSFLEMVKREKRQEEFLEGVKNKINSHKPRKSSEVEKMSFDPIGDLEKSMSAIRENLTAQDIIEFVNLEDSSKTHKEAQE